MEPQANYGFDEEESRETNSKNEFDSALKFHQINSIKEEIEEEKQSGRGGTPEE